MREFLGRVWVALAPFNRESTPLLGKHRDLETYGHTDSDTILLVCELPDMPAHSPHARTHTHTHPSPFSEFHFPLYPFRPTSPA